MRSLLQYVKRDKVGEAMLASGSGGLQAAG
jgi:hypothetical protein